MKKWSRLENRSDTRRRAEKEDAAARTAHDLSTEALAEQRRDSAQIWAAYQRRLESPAAYAVFESRQREILMKHGVSPGQIDFGLEYQRMRDGQPIPAEVFVQYLERDPFEFGSGYVKERIIQYLKQIPLSVNEQTRLRDVVLHAVDRGDRREFRRYGGLARKVDAPDLRAGLHARMAHGDPGIRRRAAWMLYAIGERGPELQAW